MKRAIITKSNKSPDGLPIKSLKKVIKELKEEGYFVYDARE